MLKETAIKALQDRFGDAVSISADTREFAVFPAKHPDVGPVVVSDDSDELTIFIGEITHGHFSSYEDGLSEKQHAGVMVEDLIEFLTDLFDDRYFLYKKSWGDGWSREDLISESDLRSPNVEWFKWSGPVHSEKLG